MKHGFHQQQLPSILIALTILWAASATGATVSTFLTAPANFEDISVAPDGKIYMPSSPGGHVIYEVTPTGVLSTMATIPASGPLGGAVTADGTLYMSLYNQHSVHQVNPDGTHSATISNIAGPTGIAASNDPRYIYVASYIWGAIYRVDLVSHTKILLANGPEIIGPDGLVVDPDENLYLANFLDSRIHKRTPTGQMSLLATLPGSGTGYIDYRDGFLYVAGLNTHMIYKVDAESGAWEVLAGTGQAGSADGPGTSATFNAPNGLALSPDGHFLYIGESGRLRRIDLSVPAPVVETLPSRSVLQGAVPNPFNPRTSVHFSLPENGPVRLSISDLRGRLIRVLHHGEMQAGEHQLAWDGQDSAGRAVASGTYLIAMEFSRGPESQTMTLVR